MTKVHTRAHGADFAFVLKGYKRGWNAAGREVRHYALPSRAVLRVCDGAILVPGRGLKSTEGVVLDVTELPPLVKLLDVWESRRRTWFEFRQHHGFKCTATSLRRPGEEVWTPIEKLCPPRTSKPQAPRSLAAEGETRQVTLATPRACTKRFEHIADLLHRGEKRLGPSPVKLGEIYADRAGLSIVARRSKVLLMRGDVRSKSIAAEDVPGLRLLADLEAPATSR